MQNNTNFEHGLVDMLKKIAANPKNKIENTLISSKRIKSFGSNPNVPAVVVSSSNDKEIYFIAQLDSGTYKLYIDGKPTSLLEQEDIQSLKTYLEQQNKNSDTKKSEKMQTIIGFLKQYE